MYEIQNALRQVYMEGVKLGRELIQLVPGLSDIGKSLVNLFNPGRIKGLFAGIRTTVEKFFGRGDDPDHPTKGSIPALIANLKNVFMHFFNAEESGGRQLLQGFKTFFMFLRDIAVQGIGVLASSLADGIKQVALMIQGKRPIPGVGMAKSAGAGGLGFMADMIMPIISALRDAWKTIQPALFSMLMSLANSAMQWVKEHQVMFVKIGITIMGYLLGRALLGAATAALSKTLIQAAGGMLSGGISIILRKLGSNILADMFGNAPTEGVSKAASKAITSAFERVEATGAKLGSKFGETAIGKMTSRMGDVANGFAQKMKFSNFGSMMGGAVGIAAAAYIAVEGKKAIDEAFESHKAIDKSLQHASLEGTSAFGGTIENRAKQIEKLQAAIQEGQEKIANRGWLDTAFSATAAWVTDTKDTNEAALADAQDTLRRLQDIQRTAAEKQGVNLADMQKDAQDAIKAQNFMGEVSLDDAKERLKTLDEVGKKVLDKNFNLQQTINDVKAKLANVSFDVLDPTKAGELGAGVENLKRVQGFGDQMTLALGSFASLPKIAKSLGNVGDSVKSGIQSALGAISEMVKRSNELDKALDGLNKGFNVKAKLTQLAESVGMGGKVNYTVNPSRNVQLNINLQVVMDVGEVERVMILRKQSIIADRLDFATIRDPNGKLAGPQLSSLSPNNPPSVPATSSPTG